VAPLVADFISFYQLFIIFLPNKLKVVIFE